VATAERTLLETDAARMAERFQALAEPKRLRILALLAAGERCVCDLTECVDTGQSLLSFHLKTLRDAGLVTPRRAGRWIYYSIDREALDELVGALTRLGDADAVPCC